MFRDTDNKALIRRAWDLPLLERWHKRLGRPLSYLGMPGPEIKDLIDWSPLLGQKTAVQIVRRDSDHREGDLDTIRKMSVNALRRNLGGSFQILRAPIEDIILNGRDMDNHRPTHLEEGANGDFRLTYDLLNFDFEGGAGYKADAKRRAGTGGSGGNRVDALRRVFDRQRGHDFVLMLTVNVRDTLGEEPVSYLQEQAIRYDHPTLHGVVVWAAGLDKGKKHVQLKTWIPIFILEEAEMRGFRCRCLPPIYYEGYEAARMVHFVFELRHEASRVFRVLSEQQIREIVQLPLLKSADAAILFAPPDEQCPEFDPAGTRGEFDFLGRRAESIFAGRGLRLPRPKV